MHNDSLLFIQTSQANMVINNEFDTIYHEHISFFNTLSMKILVERSGMYLVDVFKTDIHGTSYVFVISKHNKIINNGLEDNLNSEASEKLHSMTTYGEYVSRCYKAAFTLKDRLEEFKSQGYIIVGYGAAAKGNTLVNFADIHMDYIIDDNPLKQELLTPGQNIPIKSVDVLLTHDNDLCKLIIVPLAWNFYSEICERVRAVRNNPHDIFVKYFPQFEQI
jgi:hypothetical protein